MKWSWAFRLAIAGIVWTLLTYGIQGISNHGNPGNWGLFFFLLNPLLVISEIVFGGGDNGLPAIFNPFLLNGLFGFIVGMIIDSYIVRRGKSDATEGNYGDSAR